MLPSPSWELTPGQAYSMLLVPAKRVLEKMVMVRLATEEDIPHILELCRQLAITTSQVELSRSLSLDDYRRIFAEICAAPEHELLVAEYQGEVVGNMVLLILPNLSHGAWPWWRIPSSITGTGAEGSVDCSWIMPWPGLERRDAIGSC